MKKWLSLFCVVSMLMTPISVYADSYTEMAQAMGIMYGDGQRLPDAQDSISRIEFIVMLYRAFGIELTEAENKFADMQGHWGEAYAAASVQKGIINGISETEFAPALPITYNQAVKIILSAIGCEVEGVYPTAYLEKAAEKGIIKQIDEEHPLTREEVAELLVSGMHSFEISYSDEGKEENSFDKFIQRLGYVITDEKVEKIQRDEFPIWEEGKMPYAAADNEYTPSVVAHLVEGDSAVILFPGGGYQRMSERESVQLPYFYNSCGISVFVVNYRVKPYTAEAILADAFRGVRLVKSVAAQYGIDKTKIGVAGSSAGGHLAAMVSTLFADAPKLLGDSVDDESARPAFTVLGYPVVSFTEEIAHKGSRTSFLGRETPEAEEIEKYSGEKNVTAETPPAFIFHAVGDTGVTVLNSLEYAEALKNNGVAFELHVYDDTGHGFATGEGKVRAYEWTNSCRGWLNKILK